MTDDPPNPQDGGPTRFREAIFVHGGALGDFLLSLRIVETLRLRGARRVTLIGKPQFARLALHPGGIDDVLDLDTGGVHALFSANEALPPELSQRLAACDVAIDTLGGRLPSRLRESGVPGVISIDPRPRPAWRGHISDQWLADLREAGLDARPGPPRIEITADAPCFEDDRGNARPPLRPGRYAVLHPGSGGIDKCWPAADFAAIGRHLAGIGLQPLVLLGPVEAERMPETSRSELRRDLPVIEAVSLGDAARLIAAARLYVGNDSGISHLAAAVGTPSVAVFGPTDPNIWRPLGKHVSVAAPSPGRPWPTRDEVAAAIRERLVP